MKTEFLNCLLPLIILLFRLSQIILRAILIKHCSVLYSVDYIKEQLTALFKVLLEIDRQTDRQREREDSKLNYPKITKPNTWIAVILLFSLQVKIYGLSLGKQVKENKNKMILKNSGINCSQNEWFKSKV